MRSSELLSGTICCLQPYTSSIRLSASVLWGLCEIWAFGVRKADEFIDISEISTNSRFSSSEFGNKISGLVKFGMGSEEVEPCF